jgi:hypothetical protein
VPNATECLCVLRCNDMTCVKQDEVHAHVQAVM